METSLHCGRDLRRAVRRRSADPAILLPAGHLMIARRSELELWFPKKALSPARQDPGGNPHAAESSSEAHSFIGRADRGTDRRV